MKQLFNKHFEWLAFSIGLILMASMNPYIDQGSTFCLFELAGINFCPGEGLGHSIAFFVRGDFTHAMQAHILGPFAALIILFRIVYLVKNNIINTKKIRQTYG